MVKKNKKNIFLVWNSKYKKFTANVDSIADKIISVYKPVTVYNKRGEEMWYNDGKIYKANGREVLSVEVETLIESYAKNSVVQEVLGKIKRLTNIPREDFENKDPYLIPLSNGIYDFNQNKLIKFEPTHYFKIQIPIEYKPKAKCDNFLKFLDEVLYPEDIPLMQEWFGFCLFRKYFIKKACIWLGDKDTSKTTLLEILIKFIGEKNKTGVSLQKITGHNDFHKLSLKNRLLNAYDDLTSKDLSDGGGLKVATGGGHITAEEKFGDTLEFLNFAKHVFTANKIPPIKDNDDDAYFDRWLVFQFDNVVEKKDPFILDKLTKPGELSGILNWALKGLKRLLDNKKFCYMKTSIETKALMERSSTPLVDFISECLEKSDDERISKDDMYMLYSIYSDDLDKPKLSKTQLGRQIPIYAKFISDKRDKERYWAGVKVKENWKEKFDKKLSNFNDKIPTKKERGLSNFTHKLDTLDTSKNNMSYDSKKSNGKMIDMGFKKASKVSSENNEYGEILDPSSEKELKEVLGDFTE